MLRSVACPFLGLVAPCEKCPLVSQHHGPSIRTMPPVRPTCTVHRPSRAFSPLGGAPLSSHVSFKDVAPRPSMAVFWVSWHWKALVGNHDPLPSSGLKDTRQPEAPLSPWDRVQSKLHIGNWTHLWEKSSRARQQGPVGELEDDVYCQRTPRAKRQKSKSRRT